MLTRIYISEIQTDLQYKDKRSVKRWCRNMGIKIFSDNGSNKQYVLRQEYETAEMKQVLMYIKQKYGQDKLEEYIGQAINIFSQNNLQLEKTTNYKPKYESEKNYLSRLQKKYPTL